MPFCVKILIFLDAVEDVIERLVTMANTVMINDRA